MRLLMWAGCLRLIAGFLFITALGVGGVQAAPSATSGNGPAIWKIENDGGKGQVYLFGSVHMMKKGVVWFTPKIQGALAKASDVVLETNINSAGMQEITKFVMKEGVYPKGDSLQKHIDPALYAQVVSLAKQARIPAQTINRLKPWYAATMLGLSFVEAQGYAAKTGVEATIQAIAIKRGLPISGLETIAQQMQSLAGNAPDVQEAMLRDSVNELKDLTGLLNRMTSAWLSGDTEKLDTTLVAPMRDIPAAYEALVVRRNRNWIPKIRGMMAKPGTHFVIVGVAHLVGKDGVIAMLRAKGIKAEKF